MVAMAALAAGTGFAANSVSRAKPSAAIPATHSAPSTDAPAEPQPADIPGEQAASYEAEPPVRMVQPPALMPDGRIPAGTAIRIRMQTKVATGMTLEGSEFTGVVSDPVLIAGRTVIPSGAVVRGVVRRCSSPRRIAGRPSIELQPETLTMPDDANVSLSAVVVDTSDRSLDVNDEGRIYGSGHSSRDVKEIGIGSAAGAIIGGLSAGARGTFVGMGIGAGLTTAHWMIRRHDAVIRPGTELTLELKRPMPSLHM